MQGFAFGGKSNRRAQTISLIRLQGNVPGTYQLLKCPAHGALVEPDHLADAIDPDAVFHPRMDNIRHSTTLTLKCLRSQVDTPQEGLLERKLSRSGT